MTIHESLFFIDELRRFVEKHVDHSGPWCWPTRELAAYNLRRNALVFRREKQLNRAFNLNVGTVKEKGWLVKGPCAPHCHAYHLKLTQLGQEALDNMNRYGCGTRECKPHPELTFVRKIPA